jgi:hypothetical protein
MLSHIHIITSIEESGIRLISPSSVSFSYIFTLTSEESVNNSFQFIFSNRNNTPFSLMLSSDNPSENINEGCLEKLCLILCHPLYVKIDNKRLVGLNQIGVELIKDLENKLTGQGFSDLLFMEVNKTQNLSFVHFNEGISDENDFYNWYTEALCNSPSRLNIFSSLKNKELVNKLLSWQNDAEKKFQSNESKTYHLLIEFYKKFEEISDYKLLVKGLNEDLSSKNDYLDFILGKFKQEDEIDVNALMKIKKFYYNEYEILPTWYKRLGHIIKVIMGKRTFRSLFNDNVKKYKD